MRPMHRACAFRRLLDEDAVPSLPQSEPEWRELEEREDPNNYDRRDEGDKKYTLKNDLDHR